MIVVVILVVVGRDGDDDGGGLAASVILVIATVGRNHGLRVDSLTVVLAAKLGERVVLSGLRASSSPS